MQKYYNQDAPRNKSLAPPGLGELGDTDTNHALDTFSIIFAKFEMVALLFDP